MMLIEGCIKSCRSKEEAEPHGLTSETKVQSISVNVIINVFAPYRIMPYPGLI